MCLSCKCRTLTNFQSKPDINLASGILIYKLIAWIAGWRGWSRGWEWVSLPEMCHPDMQIISNWNQLKCNKLRKYFLCPIFLKEIQIEKDMLQRGNCGIFTLRIFTLALVKKTPSMFSRLAHGPLFLSCLARICLS